MRVLVWDVPLRLFHWLLAAAVITAVVTAKVGGNAMDWHMRCGYFVFALLGWRLLWGFAGPWWSRFRSWPFWGRADVASTIQALGHSTSGAWASLALLTLVCGQVLTGLMADDEIATAGPWAGRVSASVSEGATAFHQGLGQWAILGMVALHVCAIIFYRLARQQALLPPMLHGYKTVNGQLDDMPAVTSRWWRAGFCAVISCACVWWWIQ